MMNAQFPHAFRHGLAYAKRLIGGQTGRKRHEAAAVDARRHVARAAQAARHAMRDTPNRGVARGAPEGRVVQIQCVDIDGEHGDAARLALRDRPVALQQLLEIRQRCLLYTSSILRRSCRR